MAKIAWHTDIVVGGQGMNVKVTCPSPGRCALLTLKPDVPGAKSKKAQKRFVEAMKTAWPTPCSTISLKKAVERAVLNTKARWNKWHHETYR